MLQHFPSGVTKFKKEVKFMGYAIIQNEKYKRANLKGIKHKCIWGVSSSICTTADKIYFSPKSDTWKDAGTAVIELKATDHDD